MDVDVSAKTLISFLLRHASTLRSFELQNSFVRDVPHLIAEVPKTIQLDHAHFKFLWDADEQGDLVCFFARGTGFDAPYERSVRAYLLGRDTSMPKVKRDGRQGHPEDWEKPGIDLLDLTDDEFSETEEEAVVDEEDEVEIGVEGGGGESEEEDDVEVEDEVEEDEGFELLVEGGDDFAD